MRTLWILITLVLFGCTPNTSSDSKAPNAVTKQQRGDVDAESGSSIPNACATAARAPAGPTTTPTQLPPAPVVATRAPVLEHLTYHALPQTSLGFYAVLTPPDYDTPENRWRRYPVVVILHGSGSNEVIHGSLADDFGRNDIIYVLPRAPHPSPEQFAAGKEGYSAWPNYPAPWGDYGSPTFPQTRVANLQVHKFYTRWIAESLLDARSRYRVTPNRAIVVGHSQGAAFAHLFSADYPALVRAYAAYAGPSNFVVNSLDGPRQLSTLRSAAIVPLLVHHEDDTIVDVAHTKALDAMMSQHGIKHTTHILPGGTHATDPEVRRLLRAFIREQCCGKERTTADIPVTSDGKLSVPPAADTLAFGADSCDEHISAFTRCQSLPGPEVTECKVYEAEPCGRRSMGYRSSTFECVNSLWTQVDRATAECGVEGRDPKIAGCNVQLLRTRPSPSSKSDECDLVVRCNGTQSVVTCNGKSDGAATHSCTCTRNGTPVSLTQRMYGGDAPESCVAAAEQCIATPDTPLPSQTVSPPTNPPSAAN